MWDALSASNYWWLVPALGTLAVANVMRAYRWQVLFTRETRPPFGPALSAMLIGQFFNNVLPARAGEAARIVALSQSARTSKAQIAGTVAVERAYDVLSLLVMLFVLLPWLPEVTWLRAAAILAIVLTAGLLLAVLILWRFEHKPLVALLRPLGRLSFVGRERSEVMADNLGHGLAALRRPGLAAAALFWTSTSWIVLGVSGWLLMKGFDLGLSFAAGLLVQIAIGLGMILPSSPAAVGVFEAAVLVALKPYDIPKSQGLSYALVLHALNLFPYIAAGALCLQVHALGLRRERATLAAERHGPGGPAGLQNR